MFHILRRGGAQRRHISPTKLFHQWGEVVHRTHMSHQDLNHTGWANLPPLGLPMSLGAYNQPWRPHYSWLTPALAISAYTLPLSKKHAQIPFLLNTSSADACLRTPFTCNPGPDSLFIHRRRLIGQKMRVIESPCPGRGSTQLLTKIWGSGANLYSRRGAAAL